MITISQFKRVVAFPFAFTLVFLVEAVTGCIAAIVEALMTAWNASLGRPCELSVVARPGSTSRHSLRIYDDGEPVILPFPGVRSDKLA